MKNESRFWSKVDKRPDGSWLWTGETNTNHNTDPLIAKYVYGKFHLEDHKSDAAHRIVLFLIYGQEVPGDYEVFTAVGDNRLDINPDRLGVRDTSSRMEWPADIFMRNVLGGRACDDNHESEETRYTYVRHDGSIMIEFDSNCYISKSMKHLLRSR